MVADEKARPERNSGVEVLKILAILLIVLSHVTGSFRSGVEQVPYSGYVLDISCATRDIRYFILQIFSSFGVWGNYIFFVCSAWYLLDSPGLNKKKWFRLLIEIWIISVVILAVSYIVRGGNLSVKLIIRSFFPSIFANNWYMTCYLLFYPIHPLLNGLIERMDQRRLFRYSTAMFILYCCLNYLKYDLFFPSALILWITIYFVLAYIKRYMSRFAADFKKNTLIFVAGMTAFLMTAFVINLIGLHVTYMYDKILHWALKECNPFLLIATLGLFNIMRNSSFHSRVINYLAGLSLYIYLIHENILIRTYLRPYMINYIYETYGYEHLLGCVMVVFGVVLGIGVLGSLVYDRTMRKIVASFCDVIYDYLRRKYKAIEDRLMENKDYR